MFVIVMYIIINLCVVMENKGERFIKVVQFFNYDTVNISHHKLCKYLRMYKFLVVKKLLSVITRLTKFSKILTFWNKY